jgi:hypothetical protein
LQVLGTLVDFIDEFVDNDDEGKEPKREAIHDWDEVQETRPSRQMILRQVLPRTRSPPCKHNMKMSKAIRSGEASPCWLPRVLMCVGGIECDEDVVEYGIIIDTTQCAGCQYGSVDTQSEVVC